MPDPPVPSSLPATRLALSSERAGARMDLYLAGELGLSRAEVRRLLDRGAVSLDGQRLARADKGRAVPAAGELTIEPFRKPADQRALAPDAQAGSPQLAVVAAGPGWLAIDKPAGMPVHPLREQERHTVLGHLIARHPEIHGVGEGGLRSGVVHRLDVETSGVLLLATEQAAWTRLREAFRAHRVQKLYRAIVLGDFDPPGGELELEVRLTVARHRPARVRVLAEAEPSDRNVRSVSQSVRPVSKLRGATLVEVRPKTGFLHQIRVTLAHLGHPVLGDRSYGALQARALTEDCGLTRHLLHAAEASFEEISARADDPADFVACLDRLRLG